MSKECRMVRLDDILFFQEGPGVRNYQYTNTGVKLLNVANLNNDSIDLSTSGRFISIEEANGRYKHFLCDEGDFVIASSGITVDTFSKKMGFVTKEHLPLCMNTSTIRFRSLDNNVLSIHFFKYYLKSISFKEQLRKYLTGAVILNFGPSHLKRIKLLLCNINQQREIVELLDKASALIEKRKEQLAELDRIAESVFYDMFGDPITNQNGWKMSNLKSITTKIGSGATPKGGNESYKSEGVSLIRSLNIYNGEFKPKDLAFIDDVQAKSLGNVIIERGDVLLNITGASVARCCVVPNEILPARVNQHVSILRPNASKIHYRFLERLIISPEFKNRLIKDSKSNGATREALTKTYLENLVLILPPMSLQQQFASIIETIDIQKAKVKEALKESEDLFQRLMQDLFKPIEN